MEIVVALPGHFDDLISIVHTLILILAGKLFPFYHFFFQRSNSKLKKKVHCRGSIGRIEGFDQVIDDVYLEYF